MSAIDPDPEPDTNAQFFTLANLMPTLCWMANSDGWIFWYNRRWYEYTGTTPLQMEGWGWQSVHDPALLPSVMERWQESIKTGKPFEMTFPLKGADGQFRPFLTRIAPVLGQDGQVERWLGVNTNISEERHALELREQFMAVLGHDLRNPLASISAGLALLQRTPLTDRAVKVAGMMQASAERMLRLTNDLMDLARGRLAGGLSLNRGTQPLEPMLRQVIAELIASSPTSIVETDFGLSVPVNCDQDRLAQLFSNLLGNALTYGHKDHPVRISATSDRAGFKLSVANAGLPIDPADIEKLFQPYYRGARRPSRQGLGLGLYIAHEIAVAHGGTLDVASSATETRFTFQMPM